ncbi:MAG: tetratricopeptide repeat protein [Thermodesulfobacteriota bacterium]
MPGNADHQHPTGDPEQLGSVEFANSCAAEVQPKFNRAVAMLHSFWYEEAGRQFRDVAEMDPKCAIAWWGVAITHWQPLWEPRGPNPEAFEKGLAAVHKASELGGGTSQERAFIAALEEFYGNADTIDHRARVLAYEKAMEMLHARHLNDTEARVFYALSLLASATSLPPDKTYRRQRKAGELLMPVFRKEPNHPGAAHYIIHAYDYPPLASGALEAARRYAKIAPDSPHAQHMPSHIFTRLGLWDESIASNSNVILVARKYRIVGEELHAMDYLIFAHLQKGDDERARQVIQEMPDAEPGAPLYFASIYALAAAPARYAVERRQWKEAAELQEPNNFPGGRYAWADATIHFGRALGAARTGNVDQARRDVKKLASFRETLQQHKEDYWTTQVEIQLRAAEAWLAFAEGRHGQALELMRSAAVLEDTTDKHPVTPGQIVPARVLLGQMLLELKRPDEALAEFNNVLQAEPGRFGALYGAALAAERAGRAELARQSYQQLVEVASGSKRDEVRHAQAYLARTSKMDTLHN